MNYKRDHTIWATKFKQRLFFVFSKVISESRTSVAHLTRLASRDNDFSSNSTPNVRSSLAHLFPLRRRPRPIASSGKKGPVIIASHRDCRDRLTHENVIRISLLPTALRNDCSTSLCNIVSLFPPLLSFPLPHPTFIFSKKFCQSCRSSLHLYRAKYGTK